MDPEIIDISSSFNNMDDGWNMSSSSSKKTNFGGGIELLMNDKKRENPASDIDIEDLNNLENELNDLAEDTGGGGGGKSMFEARSDAFKTSSGDERKHSVRFDDSTSSNIKIGQSTADTDFENKTWDGFAKFNNVPMNPDKALPSQPQMSKEELLREKFKYLRRLETLETKGVTLTKKYTMESPLAEMQGEYEMVMEEKAKQNSIKFSGNMLMACVSGIEFLNNRFDPFDIKIDGWGDQISENMTDYDDVFAELYEKYKSRAAMAPELKLLFQLGGSAMMVHMTNTMFKSAMPGMDDILRQNPDLMRQFQSAAVNSMGQSNPGFAGFMNGIASSGPPPPPISTQNREPPSRPGNNSYGTLNSRTSPSFNGNDGINMRESFSSVNESGGVQKSARPEMKGPSDISDILSGLKTKTINIQEMSSSSSSSSSSYSAPPAPSASAFHINDSSTISISELKEMQSEGSLPKRTKRRPKSDKNTVSLDI